MNSTGSEPDVKDCIIHTANVIIPLKIPDSSKNPQPIKGKVF